MCSETALTVATKERAKRKRFRPNRKRYVVSAFPRIVKRDIRRYLPRMFVNAVNESDSVFLRGFFVAFGVPDMRLLDYRRTESGELKLEDSIPGMSDIDSILILLACNFELAPDTSVSIVSANIRQFRHEGEDCCEIVCFKSARGMRLYEFDSSSNALLCDVDARRGPPRDMYGGLHATKMASAVRKIPKLEPALVLCDGIFTLRLDKMNRITQLKYEESSTMSFTGCIPRSICYDAIVRTGIGK